MKRRVNIGTSSLILIFIVLCLSTFGLLSISNAKGDLNLATKNALAVKNYYEADAQGVVFLRQADQVLEEVGSTGDKNKQDEVLKARFGEFYSLEDRVIRTDIEMNFGQALHIELKVQDDTDYKIVSWKVYNRETYEIDDSIPVWTGDL